MHKIGIISDTHGMLRPEAIDALKGCALILHAGDINRQEILDDLEQIAPVHAVRGNNDKAWAKHLPESLALEICGIRVFMVHDKKSLPKDLAGTRLVVYGHSHRYEEKVSEGIFYLNPGSCGPGRFHQEVTLAILYIGENGTFEAKKVLLCPPGKKGRGAAANTDAGKELPPDIAEILPAVMREIDAGRSVEWIAAKHHISRELSGEINRMYLTHPGVDVDGILMRLGI